MGIAASISLRGRRGNDPGRVLQPVSRQVLGARVAGVVARIKAGSRRVVDRGVGLGERLLQRAKAGRHPVHGVASSAEAMTPSKGPPPTTTATAESGLRVARLLSTALVVVMMAASIAGLRFRGVYREPASVAAMLRGYDLVALVIAVPLLVATLLPSRRESPRAQLLWVSMLAYSTYNYAIYVFGTAFNAAFLLHVAAFSLSVYAMALALAALDIPGIARRFRNGTRARLIAAVLAFLAAGLGGMWVFFSLRFAITGARPGESLLVLPLAGVHLGYVLDLALLVPAYAMAAVLLWRRAPWGYALAGVLLPFTVVYQLNYLTALLFQWWATVPGASAFDPQEVPIIAAALAAAVLLFRSLSGNKG